MKNENKIIPIIVTGLAVLLGGYLLLRGDVPKQNTQAGATNAENATNTKNAQGYHDINSATLVSMFKNKDFFLVNVHIPYGGELPNTDAFVPYNTIEQNLWKLPADKNATIVLYCQSGNMSAEAAKELATLGYTNVYNLTGGMNEWEREGNVVLKK